MNHSARNAAALPAVIAACFVLFSCDTGLDQFRVLQANYLYSQGDYLDATVGYLNSLDNPQHYSHVAYNLANVYYALGEFPSALSLWEQAGATTNLDLVFRIRFNEGVLWYEQGEYEPARRAFIEALLIDPNSVDAKINLELSMEKLENPLPTGVRQAAVQDAPPSGEDDPQTMRVFDYLRRKEGQLWTQAPQGEAVPDALDW